jgi:hypothetical protein
MAEAIYNKPTSYSAATILAIVADFKLFYKRVVKLQICGLTYGQLRMLYRPLYPSDKSRASAVRQQSYWNKDI